MLPRVSGANKGEPSHQEREETIVKRIRTALGAMLFMFIIGGAQACTESPTAPGDDDSKTQCWWIDGTLHCID